MGDQARGTDGREAYVERRGERAEARVVEMERGRREEGLDAEKSGLVGKVGRWHTSRGAQRFARGSRG